MTFYYGRDENALIENHPEFAEFREDGSLVMHVDEMRAQRDNGYQKLSNMLMAVANAIEANGHEASYETAYIAEED